MTLGITSSETWLPVQGWEGLYEVSDHGRVKSLPRLTVMIINGKEVTRAIKGKILSGRSRYVHLCRDGTMYQVQVCHLVLEAFVEPRMGRNGLHWDDDPTNNHVSNLRWGDQTDNVADNKRNRGHYNSNKTHCKNGHEYTPENTYLIKGGAGGRDCMICRGNRSLDYYYRKKASR